MNDLLQNLTANIPPMSKFDQYSAVYLLLIAVSAVCSVFFYFKVRQAYIVRRLKKKRH